MIAALLLEKKGAAGMLHGPVVVPTAEASWEPIEIAGRLLAALMPQATGSGVETLFARPQGLDRVWVRFGFIPVPEADLPRAFKGRPGSGLYAWRGGTALWSTRKPQADE
jgi:N-acetylglutamate synthase-like GNAT family acetyltransferase